LPSSSFFFLVTVSLQHGQYRDIMITRIHEIAAQNPDPQAQQMLQWFATLLMAWSVYRHRPGYDSC